MILKKQRRYRFWIQKKKIKENNGITIICYSSCTFKVIQSVQFGLVWLEFQNPKNKNHLNYLDPIRVYLFDFDWLF